MFTIALVGRPNVGKSSLFNRFIGRRQALVWNQPGVTRDLLRGEMILEGGQAIEVWDLAGFGGDGRDLRTLAEVDLRSIDAFIFVVDGSESLTSVDEEVQRRLRKLQKPVVVVVNKADKKTSEIHSSEVHRWKFKDVVSVSVERKEGMDDLYAIIETLALQHREKESGAEGVKAAVDLNVFVMGRPNVGKSSLINRLSGRDISMVSEIAGTTRDKVEVEIQVKRERWRLYDTAGVRKKAKIFGRGEDPVEIFSVQKVLKDLESADAILYVVESEKKALLPTQDRKLLALLKEALKPTVIVVNKWDLFRLQWTEKEYKQWLRDQLGELAILPIVFVSAKTGLHLSRVLPTLHQILKSCRPISTGKMNQWLRKSVEERPPRVTRKGIQNDRTRTANQYLRFYYGLQTSVRPMVFHIFCNAPQAILDEDRRQLANSLRKHFKLEGIPFKFIFRSRANPENTRKKS